MILDMIKLRRLLEPLDIPIQVSKPFMNGRVIMPNVLDVTLEVLDVDGVEADDGGVQTDVCFRELVAEEVFALWEDSFDTVETGEEFQDSSVVGRLGTVYYLNFVNL